VSELGHVVGWSWTLSGDQHAFLWTRTGGIRDLTPTARYSTAAGVNDFGQVVGVYKTTDWLDRPFVWTAETGAVDLRLLGHIYGAAAAINNAGQILGSVGEVGAVIWEPDGTVREVRTIVGQSVFPTVMNEFGDLAGWSPAGAFRWSSKTGIILLDVSGSPLDINERGDVVGTARVVDDTGAAPFLWTPAGLQQLLPIGSDENTAGGVNNVRQVVGWAETGAPAGWDGMAFLWSPAAGLVPLWPTSGEDETFRSAVDINDQGAVVGKILIPDLTPFSAGLAAVVVQVQTSAAQIATAMRVRITEARRHGVINHGVARALLNKLSHIDRELRAGRAAKAHRKALQNEILALAGTDALPEAQALPLRQLAKILIAKLR
jgi:probable HAF family extracellular repeat protein